MSPTAESTYALTHSQRLIWLGERLLHDSPVNNMAFAFDWRSRVDVPTFVRAFHHLVEACDALRLFVPPTDDEPVICLGNLSVRLEQLELAGSEVDDWLKSRCARSLDLGQGLYDAALIRVSDEHHVFYLNNHHLITDGWSMAVQLGYLRKEYDRLLAGVEEPTPPPSSYADYLRRYPDIVAGPRAQKARTYWQQLAEELPEAPRLFGRSNPDLRPVAHRLVHELTVAETDDLMALLREPDIRNFSDDLALLTVFTTLCAAYTYRVSGQKSFAIGLPFHNRLAPADKQAAGVYMEIFPVRIQMTGEETFGELHDHAKQAVMDYLRNVHPGSSAAGTAHKCNVYFNLVNKSFDFAGNDDVTSRWLHPGHTEPSHHLVVKLYDFDASGRMRLSFDLNDAVFTDETRPGVPGSFLRLLELFRSDRSLPITTLHPEEKAQLDGFNTTATGFPAEATIVSLFAHQVARRGDRPAVTYNGKHLTYRELDLRSNRLAHHLLAGGLQPEELVAVCMDRSFASTIALLGIMKAGGAYLPVDADYPAERVAYLMADSGVKKVICHQVYAGLFASLPAESVLAWENLAPQLPLAPAAAPEHHVQPHDLIYMYYTSGSTGKPKGVLVQHDGVLNMLWAMQDRFRLDPDHDVTLNKTVLSFDSAVFEIFWPLIVGSRFVLADPKRQAESDYQRDLIEREGITTHYFVASLLEVYLREAGRVPHARQIISGGQELKPATLQRLRELHPEADLYNFYGPTEGSIGCTFYKVAPGPVSLTEVPIGQPVPNSALYVVNTDGNRCPVGVPGELCIGGVHTARGYHQRPELTAEKFVEVPFGPGGSSVRVYRSGDLVRWLPDGNLIFMGRVDQQVKIRGVRVEPGEVENVLRAFSSVTDALVIADDGPDGQKRLVAYLIPGPDYNRETLRATLSRELPSYLQPAALLELDAFPKMLNGKTDLNALPKPESVGRLDATTEQLNDFEKMVHAAWAEVFPGERISKREHFLDLGGHSLTGIRLMNRINENFQLQLPANTIFRYPTIAGLAEHIEQTIRELLAAMDKS